MRDKYFEKNRINDDWMCKGSVGILQTRCSRQNFPLSCLANIPSRMYLVVWLYKPHCKVQITVLIYEEFCKFPITVSVKTSQKDN